MTKTLIGIQREYIDTINSGIARWSHRPKLQHQTAGGHAGRIIHGAARKLETELRRIGFTDKKQIDQIERDAWDVAALERNSCE